MVENRPILNKTLFYALSWTWGIIMTAIGALVAIALMACGKKPHKHGYCVYFTVGKNWGGLELGMFFLIGENNTESVKWHEHGHAIQNCFWGPLMPFVICIPSALRYWNRELKYSRKGMTPPTKYDAVWFEGDATLTGRKYRKYFNNK